MSRFVGGASMWLITFTFAVAPIPTVVASTAEEFLNAPAWYLQYEVTLTSNYQGSHPSLTGQMSFTSSLVRVFSGFEALDLRSQGPGAISLQAMAGNSATGASPADAQNMTMKMLAKMDHTANWMPGGAAIAENASAQDVSASMTPMGSARIDYTRIDIGKDLTDETGGKYDQKTTTTMKGTGKVQVGGFGSVMFEIDTAEKSYVLSLPFGFNAQDARVKKLTVDFVQGKGTAGQETRSESDVPFDQYPSGLALDDPPAGAPQGGTLLRGKLDPSTGKISGEQSFKAHYNDAPETAPATLVFKYTLTMTPPKK